MSPSARLAQHGADVALLIVPGYIALGIIRARHQLTRIKSEVEFVVATITARVLVQGIAYLWPGRRVISGHANGAIDHTGLLVLYHVAIIFVLPMICRACASQILRKFSHRLTVVGLDEVARTPYAWIYTGNRKEGSYVRIWLKSNPNSAVAGKLSSESFVSMEEDQPDLYLEEVWNLDENDWFQRPSPSSVGMWVTREAIDRMECTGKFQGSEQTADAQSKSSATASQAPPKKA